MEQQEEQKTKKKEEGVMGEAEEEKRIFHERQRLQLCGVHVVNNMVCVVVVWW